MININGRVFLGSNVTIVNGRILSDGGTGKFQKFDELKSEDCSNIEKLVINSIFVDVNVSVSNSPKVEAHFYGETNIDGDVNFDVRVVNSELRIISEFTSNCFNGNLKLDVTVPQKIFKIISAKSLSADITLNKGVATEHLKMKTKSGDLETKATVNTVYISTMNGDVKLYIDAIQDVNIEISTISGDVLAEFNNIEHINLSTSTMSGDVINRHKEIRGYNADVDISTMSGDISIR